MVLIMHNYSFLYILTFDNVISSMDICEFLLEVSVISAVSSSSTYTIFNGLLWNINNSILFVDTNLYPMG